jgi:predicted MFS family arabinose efflux permease
MCILVPLIFAWAASYAIIAAALVPMMSFTMDSSWDSDLKNKKALLALIGLGIGEIFGSLIMGRILDKCSTRFTVYANALVTVSAYLVILAYARHATFSMGFACFMTFVWGW